MASVFGHALVALTLGKGLPSTHNKWKIILTGILCTILPDLDVVAFNYGIPYESFWGHRGFSHSICFALMVGITCALSFSSRQWNWKRMIALSAFFCLCTVSHAALDALTNGGLGVAFFSPFDETRYFFPWRPIAVSPIGAARFFSSRGMAVLASETIYIGIPSLLLIAIVSIFKKNEQ